jgi:hypothetical protein
MGVGPTRGPARVGQASRGGGGPTKGGTGGKGARTRKNRAKGTQQVHYAPGSH